MTRLSFWISISMMLWCGCGVLGSPVAPEDVGVAPIIERQKRSHADAAGRPGEVPLAPQQTMGSQFGAGGTVEPAEDLPVPPAQSVGTGMGMR